MLAAPSENGPPGPGPRCTLGAGCLPSTVESSDPFVRYIASLHHCTHSHRPALHALHALHATSCNDATTMIRPCSGTPSARLSRESPRQLGESGVGSHCSRQ